MNGVPEDLDLAAFKGSVLDHIIICQHSMHLGFEPDVRLSVEGKWELLGVDGTVLDSWRPAASPIHEHGPLHVHHCVGKVVSDTSLDAPRSFTLHFEGGMALRISDVPGHEAFHIEPGGIHV